MVEKLVLLRCVGRVLGASRVVRKFRFSVGDGKNVSGTASLEAGSVSWLFSTFLVEGCRFGLDTAPIKSRWVGDVCSIGGKRLGRCGCSLMELGFCACETDS